MLELGDYVLQNYSNFLSNSLNRYTVLTAKTYQTTDF